jgi:hypothetical protein
MTTKTTDPEFRSSDPIGEAVAQMRHALLDLTLAQKQIALRELMSWIAQEEKTWLHGPEGNQ